MLLIAWGCSTQKNTFLNRNYHSITTKYNGYFNARENYREGLRQLDKEHEDNYEDVLSIFRYGSDQQQSTVSGNMDIAYQKASTAIRKHSMNIRGEEYNRWIDDSYYLIARSHYFKGDHNLAILTFQYVIRQFETPLKYKSMIWVAKTHIKSGQYNNARQVLEGVSTNIEEGLLDEETLLLYNMVYADMHLQQRNFAEAVPYLDSAISLATSRKLRTRLTYILAQSYHNLKNFPLAQQSYARVLKLNPDFQMAFQARINMAMAFDTDSGDPNFILSELQGMLRDSQNRDFRDQIYYALAQFYMRQGKQQQAIENYNLSLENFRGNNAQRGITFLRLGEISLENKNYKQAAVYYDSTMTYLSREYPQYEEAGEKGLLLRELSANLLQIEREDSLQRLASMSTAERNEVLDQIIAEIEEQERLEREQEQERALMRQQMARSGRGNSPGAGGDGGWYFYNPTAISHGRNEFYAKWGERELEDLWRISNKRVLAFGEMGDLDGMVEDMNDASGRVSRAALMENVPTSPEQMKASNDRLAEAYYNTALIFKNRLVDYDAAISNFETVVTRFPDHEKRLLSAYFLYSIYNELGNQTRADIFKNMIINDFPDTDFARILSDPNYREKIINRQNLVKELYHNAYQAYINGNYNLAQEYYEKSKADTLEVSHEQAAKFSFLKALILARTAERDMLLEQLTFVTENYQETPVHEPATNMLAYLGAATGSGSETEETALDKQERQIRNDTGREGNNIDPQDAVFSFKPDAVHFYVIVANTRNVQVRQFRNEITAFNKENYADNNLNMSTLFFDQDRQILTITNFPNALKAMQFGKHLTTELFKKEYTQDSFQGFAISVENYPLFYQDRKLDEYLQFFNSAYSAIE